MHGLGQHVVDAGLEELQGLVEGTHVAQGDDGRAGHPADQGRALGPALEVAQQEPLDRLPVDPGRRLEPVREFLRVETEGGDAFAVEAGLVP